MRELRTRRLPVTKSRHASSKFPVWHEGHRSPKAHRRLQARNAKRQEPTAEIAESAEGAEKVHG
jgi:hypothetical protein